MKCKNCENELTGKWQKKFCGRSCAASYNNRKFPKRKKQEKPKLVKEKIVKLCLHCQKEIKNHRTYCSVQCQQDFQWEQKKKQIEEGLLTDLSRKPIRRYLFEKLGARCVKCGWAEKNPITGKVPVEVNHIDGNSTNNHPSNLELLCPNCHSLTETYKALNKGNGRHWRMKRYREGKSY